MSKQLGAVWTLVLGWAAAMFLLALVVQSRDYMGANPILRARLAIQEGFQAVGRQRRTLTGTGEDLGGLAPAGTGLEKPREPYNLLAGWLPARAEPAYPTAQRCHDADFQVRLERTGNFRQMTNNYKRGDPDSCSAPIGDMAMAFYKIEAVPDYGCLHK